MSKIKIIKEEEISQGVYLGTDKNGNEYISGYFNSNNGNRKWEKIK